MTTPFVLHIDTAMEWRGGQRQVELLLKGMHAKGWRVALACPKNSPLWQRMSSTPIQLTAIPKGWSLRTPFILSKTGADLFAAHTSHAHGCASILKTPLVVHRRVDFAPKPGWKYQRPEAFIAVSQAVSRVLKAVDVSKVMVVPDGVEVPPSMPPAVDSPDVLCVGARVPHKGHVHLSKAALNLPGVDIAVAGSGPLTYPGLRYLGYRDDIPALFSGSKVLVHPSVEEGMGQVVIEAMAAGLPVVVTDAGGLPEVVGTGCGIIVPKQDSESLANGIQQALSGKGYDVEKAKRRARRIFSVDAMVDNTCAAYLDILSM